MKDATGELSTTVITIVAIAAISTLFLVFLYPQLKANIILNQACSNGNGYEVSEATYDIKCGTALTGSGTRTKVCNSNGSTSADGATWTCYYKAK